jgi:hypothetical protein
MRRALVYVGLALLGLVILFTMDWSTALVYALVVALVVAGAWLLGRWDWVKNERRERAVDRTMLEAEARQTGSDMPTLDRPFGPGGGIGPGGAAGGGG